MKKKNTNLLGRLKSIILLAGAVVLGLSATANNITITNVQHIPNATTNVDTIRFSISWDNSWRNTGTPGTTQNYDGAWVFVKTRPSCSKDSAAPAANYNHAWLLDNISAYPTVAGTTLELGLSQVFGNNRATGIFIYRDADGAGTFTKTVDILWDRATMASQWSYYDPTNAPNIPVDGWDVRVYGIEMVRIPQGAFYLGDANSASPYGSWCTFGQANGGQVTQPYSVSSENAITMTNVSGNLWYNTASGTGSLFGCSTGLSGTLHANWPKGYNAFWVMKYEVTQQQITDMMNSMNRSFQYLYAPTNSTYRNPMQQGQSQTSYPYWQTGQNPTPPSNNNLYRNGNYMPLTYDPNAPIPFYNNVNNVMNDPTTWNDVDDGQTLACTYLAPNSSWNYGLWRYLDWACLRPMTEFEYEKVCRTPGATLPPMYEAPWGLDANSTSNFTYVVNVLNAGRANEVPTNLGAIGLFHGSPNTNPSLYGPRRVGSTYGPTTNRVQAGSSYYGAADMAGNVWECVVSVTTNTTFNGAIATYGDGIMDTPGHTNGFPTNWPISQMSTTASTLGYTWRGGGWRGNNFNARISQRWYANDNWDDMQMGGRGVR